MSCGGSLSWDLPSSSNPSSEAPRFWYAQAYLKAANAGAGDSFGRAIAISGDFAVVGAQNEDSNQNSITQGPSASSDNSAANSGAAYVFSRTVETWAEEAYLKAANSEAGDFFGWSTSIFGDSIVIGATSEDSNQVTITNGPLASSDNSSLGSGAAFVFRKVAGTWIEEAYLKAPNTGSNDAYGSNIGFYGDTVVVAAPNEDSIQNTITNGTGAAGDNSATDTGAAYVLRRSGSVWSEEAYVKSSNGDMSDFAGKSGVVVSGDTIAVAVSLEDSNQTTVSNGAGIASLDNSASNSGAVFVYKRNGVNWVQEAYIKPSNTDANDTFGNSVALDGDLLVVGAPGEDSNQTTITQGATASSNNSVTDSGAVYVFRRTGSTWAQEAYIKASNAEAGDTFGASVAISGNTIVVGAYNEDSSQTTITNGSTASTDNSVVNAGAAYVFSYVNGAWIQEAYLKAPNAEGGDLFGTLVAISGNTVLVSAPGEASSQATVTNGATASSDNSASGAGAVYVFVRK